MIKFKVSYLIIMVLLFIIFLQTLNNKTIKPEQVLKIQTDTVYSRIHDTVFKTATLVKKEYVQIDKKKHEPGQTIDTCITRFDNLLKEHLAMRIYSDTVDVIDVGNLVIKDTVWANKLYGKRKVLIDYKIPTVTKTITKFEEPKRQLYIGGNLFGNTSSLNFITPGVIYKNKKDQIYQANISLGFDGKITYGFGTYWELNKK
jgi:hypothetical protein